MYKLIKYGGIRKDKSPRSEEMFDTWEEAQYAGKAWKESYNPGVCKYYKYRYEIKEVK